MNKKYYAVIVAAGKGSRMGTEVPKQLLPYHGKTLLESTASAFAGHPDIEALVIVVPADGSDAPRYDAIRASLTSRYGKLVILTPGGAERGDSVQRGLRAVEALCLQNRTPAEQAFVLIHDAARPGVSDEVIDRNIRALQKNKAVCTVVPAIDSMRVRTNESLISEPNYPIIDSKVLERSKVFNVQTPQSFSLATILSAYEVAERDGYKGTDDASIAEYAGVPTVLVEGSYSNSKITTGKDIPMGIRVGTGYDVHRLADGLRLILCGVPLPSSRGLLGHSDADVAIHALMDAILGAAGKGDIGQHFPDTDEKYRGADSMKLLSEVKKIAGDIEMVNVDVTIIAERPKIAPYIPEMKKNIAAVLEMPESAVNVKATTTEGLGFTGREEGIAAIATCAIEGRF